MSIAGMTIRKPLKLIIDADAEFQAELLALKDAAGVSPGEARQYEFTLSNALDTLNASVEDHRKLLEEQQEAAKHKKFVSKLRVGSRSKAGASPCVSPGVGAGG